MRFAELLIFVLVIVAAYFALRPLQRRLERVLLKWMGRDSRTPGQGPVYVFDPNKKKKE